MQGPDSIPSTRCYLLALQVGDLGCMLRLPPGQASCSSGIAGTIGWLDPQMLAQEDGGRAAVAQWQQACA